MSKNNKHIYEYDEDWSRGERDRKDKPGKKHNSTKNEYDAPVAFNNPQAKQKKSKQAQPFRRHCDSGMDED